MKIFSITFILLVIIHISSFAQDEVISKMKESLTTEQHKILQQFEGKWKQTIQRQSSDGDFYEIGKTDNQILYGGRFVQMVSGPLEAVPDIEGFETDIIGYDRAQGKYFLFVISSLTTEPFFTYGDYDAEIRQFTFTKSNKVKINDKEQTVTVTYKFQFERDNKYTVEVFINDGKYNKRTLFILNIKQ